MVTRYFVEQLFLEAQAPLSSHSADGSGGGGGGDSGSGGGGGISMQMLEQHLRIFAAVKAAASASDAAASWRGGDGVGGARGDGEARNAGVDSRVSAEICAGLVKVVVCTPSGMQRYARVCRV